MIGTLLCEVEVGRNPDVGTILQDLEDAGYEWCDWGLDILCKVSLGGVRRTIPIFLVTNEQLGLSEGAYYRGITHSEQTTLGKLAGAGLSQCSGEVGSAILLQHSQSADIFVGEGLAIGMEAIAANCSWSSILNLRKKRHNQGKPMLSATRAMWHPPARRFAFTCC